MNTGEDAQGLRKIIDLTRLISLVILAIHFYLVCYQAFLQWGLNSAITDNLFTNIARVGLFKSLLLPKLAALVFLTISLIGAKGRKDEKQQLKPIIAYLLTGMLLYFISTLYLYLQMEKQLSAVLYMGIMMTGYLLMLSGGTLLSRLIKANLNTDVFNSESETFPQEERLLENEYSINLPAKYRLKDKVRSSWINIINPFRGILVAGTPGAGKSYFVIRHIIEQHIKKGFSMFVYDFKYDDLSRIAYNMLLKYQGNYKVKPKFWVISLDEILHRCNPLEPGTMEDITDAAEASRTIMFGLNRDWIKKTGDFFVESAINFVTAVIWFLRKYEDGKYCTLPHAIELMQVEYDKLFAVMDEQEEVRTLINPFISALKRKAAPQLEGQIASAKIGLGRLASPQLYYVLSGNDFTLDINNPEEPKIVCMGNNPQKQQIYGAVLSLYISKMIKLVNRKGQLKSSLVFDEFPSIFLNGTDGLLATCRSNLVSVTLAVQTYEQLKKDYGSEQADVLVGIVGNVISGQVIGDTAKKMSENFGKIMQDRQSLSINSSDVSVSKSTQLDYAIPAAKIATLSSGEFVGIVSDNPDQKVALKMFHAEIQNDHKTIALEEAGFKPIPKVSQVSYGEVMENYIKIKYDIEQLVNRECERLKGKYGVNEDMAEKGDSSGDEQAVVL
ncbi:conjugal transfer protein MobC [Pedobacter panaciterrae]|uniref:conjugal transfer protein MobC n=1 Tax=Pedobacter panaciterrae TaxID=363849 RepID=UPI00259300E3|nr:conjugal transfer protein MobC [uncultured Pedobacter sp.]